MNRFQTILIAIIACAMASCQDDILEQRQEDVDPSFVSTSDNGEGVIYNNCKFFIDGKDGHENNTSRSAGDLLKRTFSVHAEKEGDYYLGVHVMPVGVIENGVHAIQDIHVNVNSIPYGELSQSKIEWEFVTLKGKNTIHLRQGNNEISFLSEAPYYPEIDAVQISLSLEGLLSEDGQYNDFIRFLRYSNDDSADKIEQDFVDAKALNEANHNLSRSVINSDYSWQVTPQTLSNPDGNYEHKLNVPVTYTYHRKLSLTKGNYTFHTSAVEDGSESNVDPVMCLYKIDAPHDYCFVNDDYSGMGRHSKIIANGLPAGDYYLVVRAYSSNYSSTTTGRQGLVSIYQNGTQINTNCPVAGYSVNVSSSNTGSLNFFTAYSTGIPEFFLEESSSKKVKFFGSTFFYMSDMEQMWYDDARLLLTKPSNSTKYNMVVTACGAFGAYYGNCDVYGNCVQVGADIKKYFPNLKQYDAIYSGVADTKTYNCAAWAGGITNDWVWSSSYGYPYVWSSWDNYFGNKPARYNGALTYTREGAHSGNAEVAVWSENGDISGVTHFSVRGTANNHPHGYSWESKPGSLRRMFHPRDALNGSSYGNIIAYYRDASKDGHMTSRANGRTSLSFEESVNQGLTVIEQVELTEGELLKLHPSNRSYSNNRAYAKVNDLYDRWSISISKDEYKIISDPNEFLNNDEADTLIKYCKENQIYALVFFADLFFDSTENSVPREVSQLMFCRIFDNYAQVIEKIKKDWEANPYDENGAYIAPLPETFTKKFVKAIINKL